MRHTGSEGGEVVGRFRLRQPKSEGSEVVVGGRDASALGRYKVLEEWFVT